MSSLYSIEFKKKLERVYFLQRIKLFHKKLRERNEFYEKHFCEDAPNETHHFEKWNPHLGCVKMLCKFCAEENPDKLFVPSVNAFRGRTFPFKKKDFARAPSDYRCA